MDILDDMGVSKLSAKVFFKWTTPLTLKQTSSHYTLLHLLLPVSNIYTQSYLDLQKF